MTQTEVRDEMLMAFVDGELEPATAAELAGRIAADPALAARAEDFRRTRRLAHDAFAGLLVAAPPERLTAPLQGASVLPLRRPWRIALPRWGLALAASLLLAAALGGFLLGRGGRLEPAAGLLAGDPALLEALQSSPSGATIALPDGSQLRLLASYPVADGVCRAFALVSAEQGLRGLACRQAGTWQLALVVADPAATGGGYAPASDGAVESLAAYLDGLGAAPAMSADAEQRALRQGWAD